MLQYNQAKNHEFVSRVQKLLNSAVGGNGPADMRPYLFCCLTIDPGPLWFLYYRPNIRMLPLLIRSIAFSQRLWLINLTYLLKYWVLYLRRLFIWLYNILQLSFLLFMFCYQQPNNLNSRNILRVIPLMFRHKLTVAM